MLFQSTPSWRGRPANDLFVWAIKDFNPRPREEGDGSKKDISKPKLYFNPRPREEGDITQTSIQLSVDLFQSTPSWRGRPWRLSSLTVIGSISIHALVKRATSCHCQCFADCLFQSTPSWRGRLHNVIYITVLCYFNPRPREEGDIYILVLFMVHLYFNPRPREEGDILRFATDL